MSLNPRALILARLARALPLPSTGSRVLSRSFFDRLALVAAALLGALTALLTAGCITANSTLTGDTLRHDDLRLSVTKPPTWRFLTAKERSDGRHGNVHYQSAANLVGFPPRIVIAKHPEPHRGFNPSISIDRYPLDHLRFKTSDWLAGRIAQNYRVTFSSPDLIIPVLHQSLGGKSAATFRIRYNIGRPEGSPFQMDEQVWAVANGLTVYLITARCAQEGTDAHYREFDAILASLKFD